MQLLLLHDCPLQSTSNSKPHGPGDKVNSKPHGLGDKVNSKPHGHA